MFVNTIAIIGGLLLALSYPATCSLFTGSNIGLGKGYYQVASSHNWNLSGLSVVDTPDGIKMSGSISANITGAEPLSFSGLNLNSFRPMAAGTNLDLTLLAHQTGTLSSTGAINVTAITTTASILYTPCSSFASLDTGGNYEIGLGGSIAAGPTESPCLLLLSAIIPVALYKRRHQPISRIRS
ncbi:MAG: hypothetical protein JNK48_33345 [Bryobacterales bacterium]|nr:hypothetical protein [Bryobacterales bacterium]